MKPLRVIWVDDIRDPEESTSQQTSTPRWIQAIPKEFFKLVYDSKFCVEIIWLKTYDEWLKWASEWEESSDSYVNCFCLDHDLGCFDLLGNEMTGATVAFDICDIIVEHGFDFPYYECHSSNPVGKDKINSIFETCKKIFYKNSSKQSQEDIYWSYKSSNNYYPYRS